MRTMETMGDRLRKARIAAGFKSARSAAERFGWRPSTYAAHENGQNSFDYGTAQAYAKAFKSSAIYLVSGDERAEAGPESAREDAAQLAPSSPGPTPTTDAERSTAGHAQDFVTPQFDRLSMPLDIPVRGVAVGGTDADFTFNGDVIEYVRRPPGLRTAKAVYALYVASDSMSPRYDPGDLIYVSPSRLPNIGDYVVIELYPPEEGVPGKGFVKRLKKRTPSNVVVEQFNPVKDIEFPGDRIRNIHRVIPMNELFGV